MMAKPWAKAIAAMPGKPTPSPTTAAAAAPMNTNAKVPMNSARSLGGIRLDIVGSKDEIDRSAQSGFAEERYVGWGWLAAQGSATSQRVYSAASVPGLKLRPSALATPAP